MTDHPRFQPPKSDFETTYRDHHGGALVQLVLRLVEPPRPASDASQPMLELDRARLEEQKATPSPVKHRSAARAAVIGIITVLALSALLQVLGALKSNGGPMESRVAESIRLGSDD
jgi:hypothetical protein